MGRCQPLESVVVSQGFQRRPEVGSASASDASIASTQIRRSSGMAPHSCPLQDGVDGRQRSSMRSFKARISAVISDSGTALMDRT